jgi:sarcosine oxidase
MPRIIVIGGGIMGSAAAWQLASRGADTVPFEQFDQGHTNGSSHGSSRIFRLAYPDAFHIALAATTASGESLSADAVVTAVGGWTPNFVGSLAADLVLDDVPASGSSVFVDEVARG